MIRHHRLIRRGITSLFVGALLVMATGAQPRRQESSSDSGEEIVADLATGRVEVLVAKGAILIAILGTPSEPGSLAPQITQMSEGRATILLGAVEWEALGPGRKLVQLEREVPSLRAAGTVSRGPHLAQGDTGGVAEDIEQTGLGIFARMQPVVAKIHGPLNLKPEEPLIEAVLAGYVQGYGADVWLLSYRISQEMLREDYWQTQLLRPQYEQLWPPAKGQPRTLLEIQYPSGGAPRLLDTLRRGAAPLDGILNSPGAVREAATAVLQDDTTKLAPADAAAFLHASLAAMASPGSGQAMAAIGETSGFQWLDRPPLPKPAATQAAEPLKQQPPGAPTLRNP